MGQLKEAGSSNCRPHCIRHFSNPELVKYFKHFWTHSSCPLACLTEVTTGVFLISLNSLQFSKHFCACLGSLLNRSMHLVRQLCLLSSNDCQNNSETSSLGLKPHWLMHEENNPNGRLAHFSMHGLRSCPDIFFGASESLLPPRASHPSKHSWCSSKFSMTEMHLRVHDQELRDFLTATGVTGKQCVKNINFWRQKLLNYSNDCTF